MRRRRKARFHIPAKYILFTLSALCVAMMFASFLFDVQFTPLNTAAEVVADCFIDNRSRNLHLNRKAADDIPAYNCHLIFPPVQRAANLLF